MDALPHHHLAETTADAFSGAALLSHGAAVGLTAGMSAGGLDHRLRVGVQREVEGSDVAARFAWGTVVGGYLLPVVLAPGMLAVGRLAGSKDTSRAGAAAVQALVLTVGVTFALKALTGRPFPLNGGDPRAPDRLEHPSYARLWGPPSLARVAWPSGHTAAGFALASSFTGALPGRWWVPAVSYPLAVALGVGMVVGDHHWASDVLAGALMGQAIGAAAGRSFSRGASTERRALVVAPLPVARGAGVTLAGIW
jgi:membrane-associated phospholipid phosphatase